jgi:hypothetical protein
MSENSIRDLQGVSVAGDKGRQILDAARRPKKGRSSPCQIVNC